MGLMELQLSIARFGVHRFFREGISVNAWQPRARTVCATSEAAVVVAATGVRVGIGVAVGVGTGV